MSFWLFSWDLVKEEVIGFFREFHDLGRFGKNHNAMFSVLIPKKRRRGAVDDLTDLGQLVWPLQAPSKLFWRLKNVVSKS